MQGAGTPRRTAVASALRQADAFAKELTQKAPAWRSTLATAVRLGVPAPCMAACLGYFDSYRSPELPQNLTQAQRDAFGAHTYQRTDRPEAGFVHTEW